MNTTTIIIILIVLIVLFGGFGYSRSRGDKTGFFDNEANIRV